MYDIVSANVSSGKSGIEVLEKTSAILKSLDLCREILNLKNLLQNIKVKETNKILGIES